jgi:mRNA interferase RelE/StbE
VTWRIRITENAKSHVRAVSDVRIQKRLIERIRSLAADPDKQGKPLLGDLHGHRSVRAVGRRYRIIYRLDPDGSLVVVAAVGIRKDGDKKDVYELAKKLVRLGMLE